MHFSDKIPPRAKIDGATASVSSTDLHGAMLTYNKWMSEFGPPQPIHRIHVISSNRIDVYYRIADYANYPEECRSIERVKDRWRITDICN